MALIGSPYSPIPKEGLTITTEIPGVEEGYYTQMFQQIDDLTKRDPIADQDYYRSRYVVANFVYLIYERLQKNIVREINYEEIRSWAKKNHRLAQYFLYGMKEFPKEVFEYWLNPPMALYTCSMYTRTNRFNKHIYH